MGSRGAASGTGKHPYGSEYKTVLQDGNIKFVKYRLADNAKSTARDADQRASICYGKQR